ncbi:hypothetical protein ALC62_05735, partial [Cyphomyrmex costatus]
SQIRDKGGTLLAKNNNVKAFDGSLTLPSNVIPSSSPSSPSSPFSYDSENNYIARENLLDFGATCAQETCANDVKGTSTVVREIDDRVISDMDIDPSISSRKRNLGSFSAPMAQVAENAPLVTSNKDNTSRLSDNQRMYNNNDLPPYVVKEAHPEGEECSFKALARQSPRCINCLGSHLATSHECPIIQEHKAILSLAASDNLSLMEAKAKIRYSNENSRSSPISDPRLDFRSFPLLDVRPDGAGFNREHSRNPTNNGVSTHKDPGSFHENLKDVHNFHDTSGRRTPAFTPSLYADKVRSSALSNVAARSRGDATSPWSQNRHRVNQDFRSNMTPLGNNRSTGNRNYGRKDGLSLEHEDCLLGPNGRMPSLRDYGCDSANNNGCGGENFEEVRSDIKPNNCNITHHSPSIAHSSGTDLLSTMLSSLFPILSGFLTNRGERDTRALLAQLQKAINKFSDSAPTPEFFDVTDYLAGDASFYSQLRNRVDYKKYVYNKAQ